LLEEEEELLESVNLLEEEEELLESVNLLEEQEEQEEPVNLLEEEEEQQEELPNKKYISPYVLWMTKLEANYKNRIS